MSDQLTTLPARATDPDTSRAAAMKAVMGASKVRPIVFDIIQEKGPVTDDQIIAEYRSRIMADLTGGIPGASDSGIRTRRSELLHSGLVTEATEIGMSNFGNASKRWIAVDPNAAAVTQAAAEEEPIAFASNDIIE